MSGRIEAVGDGEPGDGNQPSMSAPREHAVTRLEAALQRVLVPVAYVPAAGADEAVARAAAVESAKAVAGLMLFQIEGLIRAQIRFREKGICDVLSVVHNACLRWLQLHGFQAHFAVPMDGWLASAFPRSLRTSDSAFIDVLASSRRFGCTEFAGPTISIPSAMLLPAQLFGDFIQEPTLASQLARLLGIAHVQAVDTCNVDQGARSPVDPIARRLVQDFASVVGGHELSDHDYPGH